MGSISASANSLLGVSVKEKVTDKLTQALDKKNEI
jgi:hypothetical protein